MSIGRATVLVEPNKLETWDVPVVDPEPGGALVRIVVGGVCGSDVHITTGEAGIMPFPIILGHEGIGRVEKLGGIETDYAGVPVKPGDLVYWSPIAACHRCYSCNVVAESPCDNSRFFEHAEKPNWGSYADYAWLPNGLAFFKLPDDADPLAVAALGCALPTVLRGFDRCGPVRVGEAVVVQGAGPVGLSAVMVAAQAGARDVIVIDGVDKRLEVARSLGATATISLRDTPEERRRKVYELTGAGGPSLVVEAAGVLPAFPEGVDLTGPHGRYVILGLWGAIGTQPISPRDMTTKNITVAGASFPKPKHYYEAMHMAARLQDKVPLASLVTHRFAIEDAQQALDAVHRGEVIKAVIDPECARAI
ncbi:alcohol dehydrogenase catalytic domain-containing protein [Sphingomonas sp. CL5.1]|uniref:zinc-binding dehydrogenase n=1 Tax=Sphingomonas sp. CL5.1 TaxID=2653203 RepID=UPI0015821E03|nr:zinc-binding dehydrogenase [Sphingomonas sp. CL5.1]QKR98326.1 alcohol dehydrogenase catalytic domain-containing protein [Sphingomonas sp. CL5.1]